MSKDANGGEGGYEPDFIFGGARIVSEANWAELQQQGVRNLVEAIPDDDDDALRDELKWKGLFYGGANLLLGDAFDKDAGRPLRNKPGLGLYTTPAGLEEARRNQFRKQPKS